MKVYSFDNLLFTNAKVPDDFVYKFLDTMEKNKPDLIAVQPALREFSAAAATRNTTFPIIPGALKYYKEHNIEAKDIQ